VLTATVAEGSFPSVTEFVAEIERLLSPPLDWCAVSAVPLKHRGPPCWACACIPFFDGFSPGILTASWSLYQCVPLSCA